MKFKKINIVVFSVLILLLLIINNSCASFRESDKKVYKTFKKENKSVQIYYENYNDKTIRYIAKNPINDSLPTLLFIHGAPGASDNYFDYLKDDSLSIKANLIAVDRLGYGYSDYGNAETSIEEQAESIYSIIQKHNLKQVIVVGWSFGVPIAAKMAYKYNEVKYLVLIAGAISPEDEKYFGMAKLVEWKLTKWMFSGALKVADDEKMAHVDELTKMVNDWESIKVPITYYHGSKDKIVPYKNMDFIISRVNDSLLKAITVKDADHFILFKHYEMVRKELLEILENLKN
jgi:pimeloyl-ACP methyl ester carboxylesterase